MSTRAFDPSASWAPGTRLGVIEAMAMGYGLLKANFWPVWLVGLIAMLLLSAVQGFGMIPYIGGCIAAATLGQVGRHFGRREGLVGGALKGR